MQAPLANDENGLPLDVPVTATGWLVRRHGGGRGRPGAVYDGDGRPLVVALDATAVELRGAGCGPGIYRLDAVDLDRRALNVIAYTEVAASVDDSAASPAADVRATTASEALLLTVARSMESMQRAQVERERQSAEIIKHLVDKLAGQSGGGAAGISWADLDAYEQRKARDAKNADAAAALAALRNRGATPVAAPASGDADDDGMFAGMPDTMRETLIDAFKNGAPMAVRALLKWCKWDDAKIAFVVDGMIQGAKVAAAASEAAEHNEAGTQVGAYAQPTPSGHGATSEAAGADGDLSTEERFAAALNLLTLEERMKAAQTLPKLPEWVAAKVSAYAEHHTPAEIAAAFRAYFTGGVAALAALMTKAAA